MKRTLEDCWESYLKAIIPDDAPDVQVNETRRAFYAGAVSVWSMLMAEDMSMETCESIQNSLDSFGMEFVEKLIEKYK